MKIGASLLLMFVPLALPGAGVFQLPVLPHGELPNSEVVTNVALNVDYARLENLTFSLELNASLSNSLSIAVGAADGDSLTLEDSDFEWCYDCGKWFRAASSTSTWSVSSPVKIRRDPLTGGRGIWYHTRMLLT